MSYDLFFKNETNPITEKQFRSYFSGRKNYSINESTACYENENTGVHFLFEYGDTAKYDPEMVSFNFSFNLNFCRPMFFIREAEPEVREFVEHFKMLVADPQVSDLESREYDANAFMSSWENANAGSYHIVLENSQEAHTLPSEVLNAVWEWNYKRDELQESLLDAIYVPKIRFSTYLGKVVIFSVWTDAIPMLIPVVDVLLFNRMELAPRKFLRKSPDLAMSLWSDFEPMIEKHKQKMLNGAYYLLYQKPPSDLIKAVRALKPHNGEMNELHSFTVLDREIMESHLG